MFKVPNHYRITAGIIGTDASAGNNGAFKVPHPKISNCFLMVIASDGLSWEHVSVTLAHPNMKRSPIWDEMCFIKDLFWSEEDCVIQYHPPKSEYVNNHPHCLHLWKPSFIELPIPESVLVGLK